MSRPCRASVMRCGVCVDPRIAINSAFGASTYQHSTPACSRSPSRDAATGEVCPMNGNTALFLDGLEAALQNQVSKGGELVDERPLEDGLMEMI